MLKTFIRLVDGINEKIGNAVAWCLPGMTLVTLVIVLSTWLFRWGAVWTSELVVYMHAILFTLAAAHTLLHDEHVRIDVFYSRLSPLSRAWVNLLGVFILLLPTCVVIFVYSVPYVVDAWSVWETSAEGDGLPLVFVLKSCILLMPLLLVMQGLSLAAKNWLVLTEKRRRT